MLRAAGRLLEGHKMGMRPVKALDGSGAHTGKVTWCISAMRLAGGTKTRTTRDRVGVFVPGRHRRAYHSDK